MAKREFYRVLPEYDGKKYIRTAFGSKHYEELIGNELLTPYMVKTHSIPLEYLSHEYVENDSWYWGFGARFSLAHPFSEVRG